MLDKNVTLYYDNINKLDTTIHNVLLYTIFVIMMYMIMKIDYISSNIIELSKFTKLNCYYNNNKNTELNRDIHRLKSKSLDTIDTNIVLQQKTQNIENEISIIKYNHYKHSKQLDEFKGVYRKFI